MFQHGLLNYYRRLVPNFAMLAEPFTKLLKSSEEFKWSKEQDNAFKKIKLALTEDPVLAHFNQTDPVCVKTDASVVGVAGILLQRQRDEWRIKTCCSRNTTKEEKNYGITDLEGLAIVYTLTKFRNYLLGRPFTIITDHCALCALKLKNPSSARLHRWAIVISEYDFSIKYISGKKHSDVDCLSRCPVDEAYDRYVQDKVLLTFETVSPVGMVVPIDIQKWKGLSQTDPEAQPHYAKAKARDKGYRTLNGLLYYEDRLFVPSELRKEVLSEAHEEPPSGHGGVRATLQRLSRYWWPKMAQKVREYISTCDICLGCKKDRQKPVGDMFSFEASFHLDLVAMDILGPMPASYTNKRHVMVAVDSFTRYIDAEALKAKPVPPSSKDL